MRLTHILGILALGLPGCFGAYVGPLKVEKVVSCFGYDSVEPRLHIQFFAGYPPRTEPEGVVPEYAAALEEGNRVVIRGWARGLRFGEGRPQAVDLTLSVPVPGPGTYTIVDAYDGREVHVCTFGGPLAPDASPPASVPTQAPSAPPLSPRASKKLRIGNGYWAIIDPEYPCVGEQVRVVGNRLPSNPTTIQLRLFERDKWPVTGPGIQEMPATFTKLLAVVANDATGTWEATFRFAEPDLAPVNSGTVKVAPDMVYDLVISGTTISFHSCTDEAHSPG